MPPKKKTYKSASRTADNLDVSQPLAVGDALPPPPWDNEVSDTASLGHPAQTPEERREALDHALNGPWAAEDISAIRRVESEGRYLWVLWRYSTVSPV